MSYAFAWRQSSNVSNIEIRQGEDPGIPQKLDVRERLLIFYRDNLFLLVIRCFDFSQLHFKVLKFSVLPMTKTKRLKCVSSYPFEPVYFHSNLSKLAKLFRNGTLIHSYVEPLKQESLFAANRLCNLNRKLRSLLV